MKFSIVESQYWLQPYKCLPQWTLGFLCGKMFQYECESFVPYVVACMNFTNSYFGMKSVISPECNNLRTNNTIGFVIIVMEWATLVVCVSLDIVTMIMLILVANWQKYLIKPVVLFVFLAFVVLVSCEIVRSTNLALLNHVCDKGIDFRQRLRPYDTHQGYERYFGPYYVYYFFSYIYAISQIIPVYLTIIFNTLVKKYNCSTVATQACESEKGEHTECPIRI